MYSVAIELHGQTRHLRYDLTALAEIEERLGTSALDVLEMEFTPKVMRVLLWAGLLHEDDTLTIRQVGRWIDPGGNMLAVGQAVLDAITGAFQVEGEKKGGPVVLKEAATGT